LLSFGGVINAIYPPPPPPPRRLHTPPLASPPPADAATLARRLLARSVSQRSTSSAPRWCCSKMQLAQSCQAMDSFISCNCRQSKPPTWGCRPWSPNSRKLCTMACSSSSRRVGCGQACAWRRCTASCEGQVPSSEPTPSTIHGLLLRGPSAAARPHLHLARRYAAAVDGAVAGVAIALRLCQPLPGTLQPQDGACAAHAADIWALTPCVMRLGCSASHGWCQDNGQPSSSSVGLHTRFCTMAV
jgi:hypothetical protein